MATELVGEGEPRAGAELEVAFREGVPVFRLTRGGDEGDPDRRRPPMAGGGAA